MALYHVYNQTVGDGTATSVVRMREFLDYNPETGEVRWLKKRTKNSKANVGDLAGSTDDAGYIRVMLDGKKLRLHRIAFLFMGYEIPEQVDHINGNRSDNRWCNLRPANPLINAKNAKRRKDSQTATTGITFQKNIKKWKVRINHAGITHYLGVFSDLKEAIQARLSAEIDFGYSERHGGFI